MLRKVGRFEAYVPDNDPFDVLLKILALSFSRRGSEFESPSYQLHRFFYKMKKRYPKLLEDVFFNHDPEFPFSEEIENAFNRLQESGYVSRPNPSFDRYRVDTDFGDEIKDSSLDEIDPIKEIADEFKREFDCLNESSR